MKVDEIPVVFECEGCELIGVVHRPEYALTRGMLAVVAGGPQYRGGVGRLQVEMARALASAGTPVMRFDYRGLGDGEGAFRGFQQVEPDLRCALETFHMAVPDMSEVVLWGGCDAASAISLNAWKLAGVTGAVLANPWVHAPETAAVAEMQHYRSRWKDPEVWKKVLRLQYDPRPFLGTLIHRYTRSSLQSQAHDGAGAAGSFVDQMRQGLARFHGDLLFLMSGDSLRSREFDVLLANDPRWHRALDSARSQARHDVPNADQAFSTAAAREQVARITGAWIHDVAAVPAQRVTA
jgi:exosortase A-associated hydrolase 1